MSAPTDQEVERLLCAVYQTRLERAVGVVIRVTWRLGPLGWFGDRLDDWRADSYRRRADRNLARRTPTAARGDES